MDQNAAVQVAAHRMGVGEQWAGRKNNEWETRTMGSRDQEQWVWSKNNGKEECEKMKVRET